MFVLILLFKKLAANQWAVCSGQFAQSIPVLMVSSKRIRI